MEKFYIRKTNLRTGRIEYKQYKCSDGFNQNRDICWQFSKQGAEKIVVRLKHEYRANTKNLVFDLVEV